MSVYTESSSLYSIPVHLDQGLQAGLVRHHLADKVGTLSRPNVLSHASIFVVPIYFQVIENVIIKITKLYRRGCDTLTDI